METEIAHCIRKIQVFNVPIASKPVYTATMKAVSQEFSEAHANLQKDFILGWGGGGVSQK